VSGPTSRYEAVVLAGGLGTRLGTLTKALPKCLVDVNGEPFAVHQLRLLRSRGVSRVTFCVGHLGAAVAAAVGDGSSLGLEVDYAFDGPRLLGTAGAIKRCLRALPESFFVIYGDSYLPCDFARVQRAFVEASRPALMTVFRNERMWDASNVEYVGGRILAYDKARPTDRMSHIDYGLGVFHRHAFELVPNDVPYDLSLLYQALLGCGQLASIEVEERFYEVGSLSGLDEIRSYMARCG
jgi:NDP-sugar pyrophosphorylase family protein